MKIKEIIEQLFTNKGKDICLPTGFYYFDKFLDGGLFRKELIIIGVIVTGKRRSQIGSTFSFFQ